MWKKVLGTAAVFVPLLALLAYGFTRDPRAIPSPIVGKPAPAFTLPRFDGDQNLSVADSPSEMAREMRDLIREQLAAGKTPEEINACFPAKYGDWILLSPQPRGVNPVVWIGPFAAAAAGPVMAMVQEYRARLEKNPRDLEALLGLAELNLERQDLGQAIEYYKRALEVDPGHPHALAHFGQILSLGGHLDEALAAFDRALSRDPRERFALWNKGWVLYEGKRDYAGAIQAWEQLLTTGLPPDDANRVSALVAEARKKMTVLPGGQQR